MMLTPKEKAKELFNQYWGLLMMHEVVHRKLFTKQCALIVVDEIMKAVGWEEMELGVDRDNYWQEVKEEICDL